MSYNGSRPVKTAGGRPAKGLVAFADLATANYSNESPHHYICQKTFLIKPETIKEQNFFTFAGMAKIKFYVVWRGHEPGIYPTWSLCKNQIDGFAGARYKSYTSRDEAEKAYYAGPPSMAEISKKAVAKKKMTAADPVLPSLSVDAACSGNPGLMEYRGVDTQTGKEIFKMGPYKQGTNNIGEFLALVHGMALIEQKKIPYQVIYTDSRTGMAWVKNQKVKTSLKKSEANKHLFNLIERAVKWLETHKSLAKILKWPTEEWGEIPADFGRK